MSALYYCICPPSSICPPSTLCIVRPLYCISVCPPSTVCPPYGYTVCPTSTVCPPSTICPPSIICPPSTVCPTSTVCPSSTVCPPSTILYVRPAMWPVLYVRCMQRQYESGGCGRYHGQRGRPLPCQARLHGGGHQETSHNLL